LLQIRPRKKSQEFLRRIKLSKRRSQHQLRRMLKYNHNKRRRLKYNRNKRRNRQCQRKPRLNHHSHKILKSPRKSSWNVGPLLAVIRQQAKPSLLAAEQGSMRSAERITDLSAQPLDVRFL
jgi:hypothetical protein